MIKYTNYWAGFSEDEHLLHQFFRELDREIWVQGPFTGQSLTDRALRKLRIEWLKIFFKGKADFFVTGENVPPSFRTAKKQIGFWRSYENNENVFRFPYWMWHLDWPELGSVPEYPRFGKPISIDCLMRPIKENYTKRQLQDRLNTAVLFSMHLREPRKRLYTITREIMGCDGFGGAFGKDDRHQAKMKILEEYRFSLCPENQIGDGYITEKIPEAFCSGCVPISWCRPEDLEEDFNKDAVVNLYGLDDKECRELLSDLAGCGEYFNSLISAPLLLKRPSLDPLIKFIKSSLFPR